MTSATCPSAPGSKDTIPSQYCVRLDKIAQKQNAWWGAVVHADNDVPYLASECCCWTPGTPLTLNIRVLAAIHARAYLVERIRVLDRDCGVSMPEQRLGLRLRLRLWLGLGNVPVNASACDAATSAPNTFNSLMVCSAP